MHYPKFTFNRNETLKGIILILTDGSVHNIDTDPLRKVQFSDGPKD